MKDRDEFDSKNLEHEKMLLSRSWHFKPEHAITLLAILIPILPIIFNLYNKDRKQLNVVYHDSKQLLTNDNKLERKIYLQYDTLKIENISSVSIYIIRHIQKTKYFSGFTIFRNVKMTFF